MLRHSRATVLAALLGSSSLLLAASQLALPAGALAADSWVDQGTGHDSGNTCHSQANPCKTVVRGINQAGTGDTVFVNGGHTYTASLTLADGKSLVHQDFAGAGGNAILDNGNNVNPDITVTANSGKIDGFTIRGEGGEIIANAPVTISHDLFNESAQVDNEVRAENTKGRVTITRDTFVDPTPSTALFQGQNAVSIGGTGTALVEHSTVTDFSGGVGQSGSGELTVRDNDFSGIHGIGTNTLGSGVTSVAGTLTVTDNRMHDFAQGTLTEGIDVFSSNGAELDRNLVSGASEQGVFVRGSSSTATLKSDALIGSGNYGLVINSSGALISAENVTLSGGVGAALAENNSTLTLDSSIVGAGGIDTQSGGTCAITFSRGPVMNPGGDGCQDFQTTALPRLKGDDYHLKSTSPMIDAGDPANPGAGADDIDGDPRALDGPDGGNCNGTARRDIGADEFKC